MSSQSNLLSKSEKTTKLYQYTLSNESHGTIELSASPMGNNDTFTIHRHELFHGVFRKYSDETLHFIKDARDYLYQIKEAQGLNARVTFTIERLNNDWTYDEIFNGIIVMKSLRFTDIEAECQIEDIGGLSRFNDRKEMDLDVYGVETLDGLAMDVLDEEITFPLQEFLLYATWSTQATLGLQNKQYALPITLSTSDFLGNEPTLQNQTTGLAFGNPNSAFLIHPASASDSFSGTIEGQIRIGWTGTGFIIRVRAYLGIYWTGTGTQHSFTTLTLSNLSTGVYSISPHNFTLDPGQHGVVIYLYEMGGSPSNVRFTTNGEDQTYIKLTSDYDELEEKTVRAVNMFTAFERLTYMISHLSFASTFLSESAADPGYLIALTTGLNIRGKSSRIPLSIESLFKALHTVYPASLGYENGKIIVEEFDYFFDDDVTLDISDRVVRGDIETEYLTDFFNELQFGFSKSGDEVFNGLEEFNTKVSYSSSTLFDKKKTIVSPYRGDTSGINNSRSNSLATNASEDVEGDDDIFMVSSRWNGSDITAKQDEGYSISPVGWLNLDFAPGRAIRRHRLGEYISLNSELKVEKREKDTTLVSQETGEEIIDEQANIPASDFPSKKFVPEKIIVNTYLTRAEVDALDWKKKIKLSDDLSGWIIRLTKDYKNNDVELELIRAV